MKTLRVVFWKGTKGPAIPEEPERKEAGLWLYEIKVENGQLKYNLVIQWPPR